MGDAPQAGLDAADDDRYTGERLARTLRIDDHRAVGPQSALTARRVGIIAADAPIARIAVDHRVHVAGGDAEEEVRLAEHAERVGALPVRLRDDADTEALRLKQAPDDRHAKARMVDVGVAGDDDDVAGIPAERVHLGAGHRLERRGPEPGGPVLAVTGDVAGGFHGGAIRPETRPGFTVNRDFPPLQHIP